MKDDIWTIVPGDGIGELWVGMPLTALLSALDFSRCLSEPSPLRYRLLGPDVGLYQSKDRKCEAWVDLKLGLVTCLVLSSTDEPLNPQGVRIGMTAGQAHGRSPSLYLDPDTGYLLDTKLPGYALWLDHSNPDPELYRDCLIEAVQVFNPQLETALSSKASFEELEQIRQRFMRRERR